MLTSFLFHDSDPQVLAEGVDLQTNYAAVLAALKEGVPAGLQAIEFLLDFEESAGEHEPILFFPKDLVARVYELRIDLQVALHNGCVPDFDRAARLDHNVQLGMRYAFGLASISEDSTRDEWSDPIQRSGSSSGLFEKLFGLSSTRWNSVLSKFENGRANVLWIEVPSGKWAYHEFVAIRFSADVLSFAKEQEWTLAVIPENFNMYSPERFTGDPGGSPFANDPDGSPFSVRVGLDLWKPKGMKYGLWGEPGDEHQR